VSQWLLWQFGIAKQSTHRAVASRREILALLDEFLQSSADGFGGFAAPEDAAFRWLADGSNDRISCRAMARHGSVVTPGDCLGCPHTCRGFAASGESFAQGMSASEVVKGQPRRRRVVPVHAGGA